ncbi:MAG: rRNA pseudouridine synthase [Oscillospiraceae bacterium]|nr:rRNA pseudouridine synthase [Oscillospiraceae bacterium]
MERLDKLLAGTGRWSRKEVKELVRQGRVQVDGVKAAKSEDKVSSEQDIRVDGQSVSCGGFAYIMLNKPAGLLSATEDRRQATVLDLLDEAYQKQGLFPVGRLDKDTTGLLLLTNDGQLAHQLLAPKSHVDKVYLARVEGQVDEEDVRAFADGIVLGDGTRCQSAGLEPLEDGSRCLVTLHEGKFHQVKRMLAHRGKPVVELERLSMGSLHLDQDLPRGRWRLLTGEEVDLLRRSVLN